jgi:hypothetical protein
MADVTSTTIEVLLARQSMPAHSLGGHFAWHVGSASQIRPFSGRGWRKRDIHETGQPILQSGVSRAQTAKVSVLKP